MYIQFYGLKDLPFAMTPDPRFIYFTPSHTEAMANLHYGIESGQGLIVVRAKSHGKTPFGAEMQRLDRRARSYIFNPVWRSRVVPSLDDALEGRTGKQIEVLIEPANAGIAHARGLRTGCSSMKRTVSTALLEDIVCSKLESDRRSSAMSSKSAGLREAHDPASGNQAARRAALRDQPLQNIARRNNRVASGGTARSARHFSPAATIIFFAAGRIRGRSIPLQQGAPDRFAREERILGRAMSSRCEESTWCRSARAGGNLVRRGITGRSYRCRTRELWAPGPRTW